MARFNQLIEQIAARNISRAEAFRQMEAIERDLLQEAELEAQAIEEEVGETARELKKSELAEPVAKSLASKDLAGASKALRDLGARLRGKGGRPDAAELERLRQALARAAERKQEALRGLEERRAELRRQLLKKKPEPQDAGAPEEREQRLLRDKERELQRLDRQIEQQQRAARSLSKLDRDLAKAAEDLLRDLGMSADDLEQAAEDLSRMEQQEPSDQDKEALRQRLQELRELIRQQGQGGRQRMARMLRFGQRARGARGGEGGEEQELLRRSGRPGAQGQGELMLGRGSGAGSIPIPSGGGERSGERGGAQGSNEPGGKEAGTGTGGPIAGQATDPKMGTLDTQADGLDNKAGPTRAQVIYGAGDRGFRGRPYREVFKQYRTVAEDQVEREKIPDGYRFYVRRYFQLIRPRE
ncbi:MAG: hypothetical protein HY744_09305 [Deltaproteobacteria bacterium]|nr:hypothetical protein [Deltaproteobacteria bacterium]